VLLEFVCCIICWELQGLAAEIRYDTVCVWTVDTMRIALHS